MKIINMNLATMQSVVVGMQFEHNKTKVVFNHVDVDLDKELYINAVGNLYSNFIKLKVDVDENGIKSNPYLEICQPMTMYSDEYKCQIYAQDMEENGTVKYVGLTDIFTLIVKESTEKMDENLYPIDPGAETIEEKIIKVMDETKVVENKVSNALDGMFVYKKYDVLIDELQKDMGMGYAFIGDDKQRYIVASLTVDFHNNVTFDVKTNISEYEGMPVINVEVYNNTNFTIKNTLISINCLYVKKDFIEVEEDI